MNLNVELTKNNFCQYGFNGNAFNARNIPSDSFNVSYKPCERLPLDWRAECLLAAREIYRRAGNDLRVCLSGGIDSEIVGESFRFAGIPFRAVILRHQPGLNIHDISWAIAYCESHNIPYDFIDINVLEFLKSDDFYRIAKEANCNLAGIVVQIKLMETVCKRGQFPVLGAGDIQIKKFANEWRMALNEDYWSPFFYQSRHNLQAASRFFHWTPELIFSFLKDPLVTAISKNKYPELLDYRPLKHDVLKQYFNLPKRHKYYGFEKYASFNNECSAKLSQMNPKANTLLYLSIDSVISQLAPKEDTNQPYSTSLSNLK